MERKKKVYSKRDTIIPNMSITTPLYGLIPLSSTTSVSTTRKANLKADVEEWFKEHKVITFGLVPCIIILFIVVVCCCRLRNKKQQKLKGHSRDETMTQYDYELPKLRKTAVQPRMKHTEIKELGKLEFSVKYEAHRSRLNVNVARGEDFPLLSSSNVSFTYVVVELRPFSQKYEAKAQTRYVRNTVSPIFNDSISYQIPEEELLQQTLFLFVYDINHLSAHDLIGSVKLQLEKNLLTGYAVRYKERLRWNDETSDFPGDILVGLHWKEKNEMLDISIQEASSLKVMDEDRLTSNPYVKVQIYVNSFLVLKKRTKVEKRNRFPKFRKTYSVYIPHDFLFHKTQIVFTVKHVGKFRKKQMIGELYLGHDGKELVKEQWNEMKKTGGYIEMWHRLEPSVEKSIINPSSKVNYLRFDENNSDVDDKNEYSSDRSGFGGSSFDYKSF